MEQLDGLDASFLAMESANQTGHVASLMLFDASDGSQEPVIDGVRRKLAALGTASGLLPLAHSLGLGRLPGVYRSLGLAADEDGSRALPESPSPKKPFNGAITPHRRFAWADLGLAEIKQVRRAFEVTLNDVARASPRTIPCRCSSTARG